MRITNNAGYVHYTNEEELCTELENHYFQCFFDAPWEPTYNDHKEVWIDYYNRIDYAGYKNEMPCFVEVKNWFITEKDTEQIIRYDSILGNKYLNAYEFYVICGGVDADHYEVLVNECDNLHIVLTKDIKELMRVTTVYG